jgi:hypothetical protein
MCFKKGEREKRKRGKRLGVAIMLLLMFKKIRRKKERGGGRK